VSKLGPEHFPEPVSDAIPWIRKRDRSVVPFDPGKLASSIFSAVESLHYENPGFVTQELAPPVIHFLAERVDDGEIPTSEEVSETVINTLRQLGHADVAQAYAYFARRRGKLREGLRILPDARHRPDDRQTVATWSKTRLIERLEGEADLDATSAREVAVSIEKRILATGLEQVTAALIDELIYCEFLDRGIQRPWARRSTVAVPRDELRDLASQPSTPASILHQAGHRILREYALRDVFSRDVAALVDEQMLHLLGQPSPVHWSARSIPVWPTAGGARAIETVLDQWEESVESGAESASSTIALEGLDAVLARLASSQDRPAPIAMRIAKRLSALARRYPAMWIVNLFGAVPTELASGWWKESLFDDRSPAEQDRWAREFGTLLLSHLTQTDSIRVDMHLDALLPTEETEMLVRQMLRGSLQGLSVGFAFDRPTWSMGEGLFAPPSLGTSGTSSPAVIEYVGIDLPRLLDRLGGEDDGQLFLRRLDLLCDSAVRLAIQKREHLRKRDDRAGRASSLDGSLVLTPIGLPDVVARMVQADWLKDEVGLTMAERIVRRMAHRSSREGKPYRLTCHVDSVAGGWPMADVSPIGPMTRRWASQAMTPSVGRLHSAMGGGTALLRVPSSPATEELLKVVMHSLNESTLCRLVLAPPPPDRQPRLFE
jgi:hypothetical protein